MVYAVRCAVNYPAKQAGVNRMDSVAVARQKCPSLLCVHVETLDVDDMEDSGDEEPVGEGPGKESDVAIEAERVCAHRCARCCGRCDDTPRVQAVVLSGKLSTVPSFDQSMTVRKKVRDNGIALAGAAAVWLCDCQRAVLCVGQVSLQRYRRAR